MIGKVNEYKNKVSCRAYINLKPYFDVNHFGHKSIARSNLKDMTFLLPTDSNWKNISTPASNYILNLGRTVLFMVQL